MKGVFITNMVPYQIYLEELRVRHWIKNLLVFTPAFFTLQIYKSITDRHLFFAFISFCLAASIVYVINDLRDVVADKINPNNKNRPYASGMLSIKEMYLMIFVLSVLLFAGLSVSRIWTPYILYIFVNIMYSTFLKKIPLLDMLAICLGFELRIWAGADAINVALSQWLISMVFLLALFLVLSKRRAEVMQFSVTGIALRENISFYKKLPFRSILYGVASLIFLLYMAYCFSPEIQSRLGEGLYLTSFFVAAGLSRYLYLILGKYSLKYPTDIIWKDFLLQVVFIAWALSLFILIY